MTEQIDLEKEGLSKEQALDLLRQMWEIRMFENRVYDLLGRNIIKGASHLYAGQEAVAVGAVAALRDDDLITSTHRGHGHCHARGAALAKTKEARITHYNRMLAELCGRATGYCLGRGGSMHIADVENGNLGATGIVGGNLPVATGAALAQQMLGSERVVLCFFGDGASNTGNFHESLNLASRWCLPVVYIVENNLYGMSVPFCNTSAMLDIADRACAYGMEHAVVDGMDVLAVRQAVGEAVERARAGQRPDAARGQDLSLLWAQPFRPPRLSDQGRGRGVARSRDAIDVFAARLVESGICEQAEIDALEIEMEDQIDAAQEFALNSPFPDPVRVGGLCLCSVPVDGGRLCQGAALAPALPRGRAGHAQGQDPGGVGRGGARRDAARRAGLYHGRRRGPLWRGVWRDARAARRVWLCPCQGHADQRGDDRRLGGRRGDEPACGRSPRSCTSTLRRWRWTRSPTRGPRTATCLAARRPCRW